MAQTDLSRQSFLGASFEQTREVVNLGLVGLGGGGSHIAHQCAHLGFMNYRIFDPDKIENSNLNRLVGGTALDVAMGTDKAFIAERAIRAIRPDASVKRFAKNWYACMDDLKVCDVVFSCVDSFVERQLIEGFCRRYRILLIDIGMTVKRCEDDFRIYGQVAASIPGLPCFRCMGLLNDKNLKVEAENYGNAGPQPQVVWANGVLASLAVGQLVSALSDWNKEGIQSLYLEFDGNRPSVTESNISHALRLHKCPHYQDVDVGDLEL